MALNPVDNFFNNKKIRSVFLKLRYPLFIVLFLLLLTQLEPRWFVPGLLVSVLGELLQLWCLATIKTQKTLTRTGPYMFLRNPMYIGRFFLICGVLMMTGNIWILAGFALLYFFYMTNRVRREEKKLQNLFGSAYEAYCQRVKRYTPTVKNFQAKELITVSWESFFQNNAHLNILLVIACYLVLFLATFVWPVGLPAFIS